MDSFATIATPPVLQAVSLWPPGHFTPTMPHTPSNQCGIIHCHCTYLICCSLRLPPVDEFSPAVTKFPLSYLPVKNAAGLNNSLGGHPAKFRYSGGNFCGGCGRFQSAPGKIHSVAALATFFWLGGFSILKSDGHFSNECGTFKTVRVDSISLLNV